MPNKIHHLKTWPAYFAAVVEGKKTAELRRLDRDFQVGDALCLMEWEPPDVHFGLHDGRYTGQTVSRRISHIVRGDTHTASLGLDAEFGILSFSTQESHRPEENGYVFEEPFPENYWPDNPDLVKP